MSEPFAQHVSSATNLEPRPLTFILPGIADERTLWEPMLRIFDSTMISYLDWTDLLQGNMASLVEHVTKQIVDAQPSGELRLIGYSIGGQLGFAVTMALQAAGIQVSHLVLLDAGTEVTPIPKPLGRVVRELLHAVASLLRIEGIAALAAKCITRNPLDPLLRRLSKSRRKRLPFDFDRYLHIRITIQLMRRIFWPWWRAIIDSGYSLPTPTFLFRASDRTPAESEDLGWRRFFPNLTIISITATHDSMMKSPAIEEIGEELQSIFAKKYDQ